MPHQLLRYAQDLALLRQEGRGLRRRIEAHSEALTTVLIVDDEELMRTLIAATLSPETYAIMEAGDGSEALELIGERHPSLVILDQRMPGIDGITVCERITRDPALSDIMVVMLTGDPADEVKATAAGADAFVTKPFRPMKLLEIIEALLLRRTRG